MPESREEDVYSFDALAAEDAVDAADATDALQVAGEAAADAGLLSLAPRPELNSRGRRVDARPGKLVLQRTADACNARGNSAFLRSCGSIAPKRAG
jgi:hypothetical protein